jgi:hypothetical protein
VSIITLGEAQAWAEDTKLHFDNLDPSLLAQVSSQVKSRISSTLDVSGWIDNTNTPDLVRNIIAMQYVSWYYSRTYSEDASSSNDYALRLLAMAEELLTGIISGIITLPEVPVSSVPTDRPTFYPTDLSSAQEPTFEDPSLGGARFTLGQIF